MYTNSTVDKSRIEAFLKEAYYFLDCTVEELESIEDDSAYYYCMLARQWIEEIEKEVFYSN